MKNETTKQRILAKAVKLFAKEGYEAVSVEQIAAAAAEKGIALKGMERINLGEGIVTHGTVEELLHDYGLDAEGILRSAVKICSDNGNGQ